MSKRAELTRALATIAERDEEIKDLRFGIAWRDAAIQGFREDVAALTRDRCIPWHPLTRESDST